MSTLIPSQVENRMISAGDPYPPGWEQEPETEEEYQERVEATKMKFVQIWQISFCTCLSRILATLNP